MSFKKEFYIIRHGETDWNKLGLVNGITDRPLTKKGINQAEITRDKIFSKIKELNFKTIVHSPLSRAKDTASIINQKLNLPMIEVLELREASVGELEGKPHPSHETWQKWINGEFIGNGVESFEDGKKRVKIGLQKALEYENPLIVAHGGVFFQMCSILNIQNNDILFENCVLYHIRNTNTNFPTIRQVFNDDL